MKNYNKKKSLVLTYDDTLGGIDRESNVTFRNMGSYKSERELRRDLLVYFSKSESNLLLIEIDFCQEGKHISFFKYVYEKVEA